MNKKHIKLANTLVRIDNSMAEVYKLSKARQSIKYNEEVDFEILYVLQRLLPDFRVMAGRSWTFYMANCTITIRRKKYAIEVGKEKNKR